MGVGDPRDATLDIDAVRVVVLADGAPEAGRGHLSRCSGVIGALMLLGVRTQAVALDASDAVEFDGIRFEPFSKARVAIAARGTVVLGDSYRLEPETVRSWDPRALAWFDDAVPARDVADVVVIAPRAAGAHDAPGRRVLGGFEHVSLRPGMGTRPRTVGAEMLSVLVTLGASPTAPTMSAARGIVAAVPSATVRAVTDGPLEEGLVVISLRSSLADELERADIVVCAGGQTALEAAAWGIPAVIVPIADNQRANVEQLRLAGAALVADDLAAAGGLVRDLAEDHAKRDTMSRAAREVIDGRGAARIAMVLAGLAAAASS